MKKNFYLQAQKGNGNIVSISMLELSKYNLTEVK